MSSLNDYLELYCPNCDELQDSIEHYKKCLCPETTQPPDRRKSIMKHVITLLRVILVSAIVGLFLTMAFIIISTRPAHPTIIEQPTPQFPTPIDHTEVGVLNLQIGDQRLIISTILQFFTDGTWGTGPATIFVQKPGDTAVIGCGPIVQCSVLEGVITEITTSTYNISILIDGDTTTPLE